MSILTKAAEGFALLKQYDSWSEFVNESERIGGKLKVTNMLKPFASVRSDMLHNEQAGGVTFDQAMELANNGWPDGASRLTLLTERLSANLSTKAEQTHYTYDVTGEALDVATYLSGEPECWQSPVIRHVDGHNSSILKIVIDMGAHWDMNAEQLFRKGAMVISLVSLLEMSGYHCEIIAAKASQRLSSDGTIGILTTVKHADNVADFDKLAFALAHPASNRRLLWAHVEDWRNRRIDTRSVQLPAEYHGDIYLPWNEGVFSTDEEAHNWIKETIKQF